MAEKKAKCDNCGHTVNVVNDHSGFGTLRRLDLSMKCCPKPFYVWEIPARTNFEKKIRIAQKERDFDLTGQDEENYNED